MRAEAQAQKQNLDRYVQTAAKPALRNWMKLIMRHKKLKCGKYVYSMLLSSLDKL